MIFDITTEHTRLGTRKHIQATHKGKRYIFNAYPSSLINGFTVVYKGHTSVSSQIIDRSRLYNYIQTTVLNEKARGTNL